MNSSMKMGLVKVTLFSILLALSGMAAIASAADGATPIRFYGNATLNDESATTGMVINAYIDDEPSGTYTITVDGKYYIDVQGNESDEGELITFEICGATADQTDTWHASTNAEARLLDLTAVDDEAPVVTNANANPTSIVADGVETTQLNATVIDGCGVGPVTVDLSDIGGDEAQNMTRIGDTDVYSVTVTAAEGTAGVHCLYVNASDVFGKCNTSVCIALEVVEPTTTLIGDINGDCKVDYRDLGILGATYGLSLGDSGYNAAADLNGDNMVNYRDLGMLGAHYGEVC